MKLIIFLLVVNICLLLMYSLTLFYDDVCVASGTVVSVGGCDKFGGCGVTLNNGAITQADHPSIGQTVCYQSQLRQKF